MEIPKPPAPTVPKKQNPVLTAAFILAAVLFAASSGSAYYFYSQNVSLKSDAAAGSSLLPEDEVRVLSERVGRHIVLPAEAPVVATVTDPDALRGQPFFLNAKLGDKVLIFVNARKAILYDPIADKIIEAGPFVVSPPTGGGEAGGVLEEADGLE